MALCDTELKNQMKALTEFKDFDKKLGSMTLHKAIKKLYMLRKHQSTRETQQSYG